MVGSLIEAHLFGSMEDGEECDYDHILIHGSSVEGGDKENCSTGETIQTCARMFAIETELMQSLVENDLHEGVELQNELWHALDILIDEHENVEMLSQSKP